MTSNNINQGPTLAQLNDIEDPFEDIDSIIRNDPINKPATDTPGNPETTAPKVEPGPITVLGQERQKQVSPTYSTMRSPGLAVSTVTMVTSTVTPRVSLTINVPVRDNRNTTCTITSPAQEVPMQSESPAKTMTPEQKVQKPVFNYLLSPAPISQTVKVPPPVQSPRQPGYPIFSVGQHFFMPTLSTVDQSSLQRLLGTTAVKTEPPSPSHTELSRPELHPTAPEPAGAPLKSPTVLGQVVGQVKIEDTLQVGRTDSPTGSDSNSSNTSFNQKWEEIKRYLETSEENKASVEPPLKKQKIEPGE